MEKNRLEAFSNGVLAIIITIMVLELSQPAGDGLKDLLALWPTLMAYGMGGCVPHVVDAAVLGGFYPVAAFIIEAARAKQVKILPLCPYAKKMMCGKEEYQDVL